jgi:hypothetical protein
LFCNALNSTRTSLRGTNHRNAALLHGPGARSDWRAVAAGITGQAADEHATLARGAGSTKRISPMKTKAITAAAALLALGLMSSAGFAQAGLPDDPMSNENTIPAPDADVPTDPSANDNPAARAPTSPPGTGQYELQTEGQNNPTSGDYFGEKPDQGNRY